MISVITPVYNGERFIEACIKVVIEQNCPDVEHIIVDGGSTDQTVEIIKQYTEKYPHIRWISEKDKGQSDAMNKGIAMGKGDILAILNVDDYYEPNVLNRALELFKDLPEPSLLVGNCNVWDERNKLTAVYKPSKCNFKNMLQGLKDSNFPTNPSAYFYHSSLHERVGLYEVDEHYAMDLEFLLRVVQVATVNYVDETWGNWVKLEGTKTVTLWQNPKEGHKVVNKILRKYRKYLPKLQRWEVAIKCEFDMLWRRNLIPRLKYYFQNPKEITKALRPKKIINALR
jgi:glycosyltransferase involved in cell wall biosynthesis